MSNKSTGIAGGFGQTSKHGGSVARILKIPQHQRPTRRRQTEVPVSLVSGHTLMYTCPCTVFNHSSVRVCPCTVFKHTPVVSAELQILDFPLAVIHRKVTCRAQTYSDIQRAKALPGLGVLLMLVGMLHPDLWLMGVDIFWQTGRFPGSTDFGTCALTRSRCVAAGKAMNTFLCVAAWHNDVESESNPWSKRIVRTVVIKLTPGMSYFTVAGYEDTYYDYSAGSWVSFCSAAQHKSANLSPGDNHLKVAILPE